MHEEILHPKEYSNIPERALSGSVYKELLYHFS
jgi:hypothetical protein